LLNSEYVWQFGSLQFGSLAGLAVWQEIGNEASVVARVTVPLDEFGFVWQFGSLEGLAVWQEIGNEASVVV
jgi:hypothetical protein